MTIRKDCYNMQIGVVYKLVHKDHPDEILYIGSTKMALRDRLQQHRFHKDGTDPKSEYIKEHGVENFILIELERMMCNRYFLQETEQHYIERYTPPLNKRRAHRTAEHTRKCDLKYKAKYRANHRKELAKYSAKYYAEYHDDIRARQNEKITCKCGCLVTRVNMARHLKTKKHCFNIFK